MANGRRVVISQMIHDQFTSWRPAMKQLVFAIALIGLSAPAFADTLTYGPRPFFLVDALPDGWERAPAFVFAPIASEIPDDWVDVPQSSACVAFAWQGILRNLAPGERVTPKAPGPSPFLERADVLAFSRHDVPSELSLREIGARPRILLRVFAPFVQRVPNSSGKACR